MWRFRVKGVLLLLLHSKPDIGFHLSPTLGRFLCTDLRVSHRRVSCTPEGDRCC